MEDSLRIMYLPLMCFLFITLTKNSRSRVSQMNFRMIKLLLPAETIFFRSVYSKSFMKHLVEYERCKISYYILIRFQRNIERYKIFVFS